MASSWPKSLLLFSFFNVKKDINKKGLQRNKQEEYCNLKILMFEMLNHFGAWVALSFRSRFFVWVILPPNMPGTPLLPGPSIWPLLPGPSVWPYALLQVSDFHEGISLYICTSEKKKKGKREAHALISNKPVTGQTPALQAPTCFLAFHQHSFYPQNAATSGCLAAKWHDCP